MNAWAETEIGNTEDVLDSRQIGERIKYLEAEKARLHAAWLEAGKAAAESADWIDDFEYELPEEEAAELAMLVELRADVNSPRTWEFGITFIHESHFEDYAQQLAENLGLVDDSARWPANHIDWEEAANTLRQDYQQVDFGGETYWWRE